MRLNTQGYCRYMAAGDLDYQPFSQRFEHEVAAFRSQMAVDLDELAYRVRFFSCSFGKLPDYMSLADCPPDVDV